MSNYVYIHRRKFPFAIAVLSVILIALLFFSLLSSSRLREKENAYASFGTSYAVPFSGSGTELDPYLITSENDLVLLSALVNGGNVRPSDEKMYAALCYRLSTDIDLTSPFTPIGKEGTDPSVDYYIDVTDIIVEFSAYFPSFYQRFYYFDGNNYVPCDGTEFDSADPPDHFYYLYAFERAFFGQLDGAGHTISGLTVNSSLNAGLFGYIVNAKISNLVLEDATVVSQQHAGCIAGRSVSSAVENCVVLSSSVTSSGAGAAVGGGVGLIDRPNTYSVQLGENSSYNQMEYTLYPFFNQPRDASVSQCYVEDVTLSSVYREGGLIGLSQTADELHNGKPKAQITDCFATDIAFSGNAEYSGSFIGEAINADLSRCLSVEGDFVGNGAFFYSDCIYPSDISSDATVFCAFTTDDIIRLTLAGLFGSASSWQRANNVGNTFYYPSPNASHKKAFTAYGISFDGTLEKYIYAGQTYTLPAAPVYSGYAFSYYLSDATHYQAGDDIVPTDAVNITTVYTLSFTPAYTVFHAAGEVSVTYNAQTQTVTDIAVTGANYTLSYAWFYSTDGENYSSYANTSALTVRHVVDAYFYCAVTADNDPSITIINGNTRNTDVLHCTVAPKSATVTPHATYLGESSFTFTGETLTLDYSYDQEGIYNDDLSAVSFQYSVTKGTSHTVRDAGEYAIAVACSHADYSFGYSPTVFTVEPATIICVSAGVNTIYDGSAHSIAVGSVTTAAGEVYTVTYSTDGENYSQTPVFYTNCVDNATVYFRITANNHTTYAGEENVTVSPSQVTLTKTASPVLEKIYDGTANYPVGDLPVAAFSASCTGEFSGAIPVSLQSLVASSAHSGNVTITANFALSDANFVFASGNTLSYSGKINKGVISIAAENTVRSTYTGSTRHDGAVIPSAYSISSTSPITPGYYLNYTESDSIHVSSASILYAHFALNADSINDFEFDENNGVVAFDFILEPKEIEVIPAKIHAADKDYDGLNTVEIVFDDDVLSGVVLGDTLLLRVDSATVPSANASLTPYAVTATFSLLDPTNVSTDYVLADVDFLTVTVSPAEPTVRPVPATNTVYRSSVSLPALSLTAGDTEGEIAFDIPTLSQEGPIDWDLYLVEENIASFSYTFTPTSSNYTSKTGSISLNLEDVIPSYLSYEEGYTDAYNAFEDFDIQSLTVWVHYNDGSSNTVLYAPGYGGYSIHYNDPSNKLYAADTFISVYYQALSVNVPVTVRKINRLVSTARQTFVFKGSAITFNPAGFDSAMMEIENNAFINVSEYIAVVSLSEQGRANYLLNGASEPIRVSWAITPMVKYSPYLAETEFTYTGEPIEVVIRNEMNVGNDFFIASGDLSATNGGTYTVTLQLKNNNYSWKDYPERSSFDLTWEILPATVSVPVIYNLPFVYDEEEHTLLTDTSNSYEITGDLTYQNAGSYSITATLKNTNNYVWADEEGTSVTINYEVKHRIVTKPNILLDSFDYSGNPNTLRIPSNRLYYLTGEYVATNAGYYFANIVLDDPENNVWTDGTNDPILVEWAVHPYKVILPVISGNTYYSGKEISAPISVDEKYCTATNMSATEVGTYPSVITLKDSNNTIWSNGSVMPITLSWSILPSVVQKPEAPENVVYNGLLQTANIPKNAAYTLTGNQQTNVGTYQITVALVSPVNYVWSDDTTDTLHFTWKICSLNLSSNNESTSQTTYSLGSALPTPYLSGYTFEGWYATPNYSGAPITSLDSIDENTVLYAKWTADSTNDTSISGNKSDKKDSVLSEKAIIGIAIGGGAFVIAVLIILLGLILKRGGGGRKGGKSDGMTSY